VVGGVVGLAGIGAAIFMFILMKKKKQAQQPAYEPAPTDGSVVSSPPPPPPPPPMSESLPSPSEVSGRIPSRHEVPIRSYSARDGCAKLCCRTSCAGPGCPASFLCGNADILYVRA
jgi:hypothetical protein